MADALQKLIEKQTELLDVYERKWVVVDEKISDAIDSIENKKKESLLLIEETIKILDKEDAINSIKEASNEAIEKILDEEKSVLGEIKKSLDAYKEKLNTELENFKNELEVKRVNEISEFVLKDDYKIDGVLVCFGAECVNGILDASSGHLIDLQNF